MNFRYDHENDVLDIRLAGGAVARTEQIDTGTLVDLDMHGRVLTIEVIAPGRPWPLDEIVQRFQIGDDETAVLRDLWNNDGFAYARANELVPA
jgi:uncharacterized protein YuzE